MTESQLHDAALVGIFAVAIITFVALLFVTAPYGRHLRRGWGPTIPSAIGWVLMESVAVAAMGLFFLIGDRAADPVPIVFFAMWQAHYLNRAFVYPFLRRGGSKPMPATVVLMAVVFNSWNGYLNGRWLFTLGPARDAAWFADPRFIAGAAVFALGMAINWHCDAILRRLREPGRDGYRIPVGGLFRFVSMPNYLGELVEWLGWALATWSLAGLSFAVFTAANLVPRALANHRWYRETFPDYPKERRAILPFIL